MGLSKSYISAYRSQSRHTFELICLESNEMIAIEQSTELRYQVTWIVLIQYAIAMPPGGWLWTFWQIDDK